MIIIAFKPLDYRKQVTFPPLILRITPQIMNKNVYEIKKTVHQHFKQDLSPFINENNLNLSNKQSQSMINDLPFYMYLDQSQFTQYIMCTTKPNITKQNQLKWKFIKNSLIFMIQNEQEIYSIPQKQISILDQKLKNILLGWERYEIIVNSSIMKPNNEKKWSAIFNDNWKQFAHQNDCIYVKINKIRQNQRV